MGEAAFGGRQDLPAGSITIARQGGITAEERNHLFNLARPHEDNLP